VASNIYQALPAIDTHSEPSALDLSGII